MQSNEYPANPEAIQYLFNIATQNNALMNVMYAEDSFKTIVKYIKDNKTAYVVTGMPQTKIRFCTASGGNLRTSPSSPSMRLAPCTK